VLICYIYRKCNWLQ